MFNDVLKQTPQKITATEAHQIFSSVTLFVLGNLLPHCTMYRDGTIYFDLKEQGL